MLDLKILRKEQQHKLTEIATNITEREQKLGELSSRIKYAEEYFESLEKGIERLNENLHQIEVQGDEAKTAQKLKFEIDELKHELTTATERCAIRDQEKDKTIQDLRNSLDQKEVSLKMSRAKINQLEEKAKKFAKLNQELTDIKKMHEEQKTDFETLISELKVANQELSGKCDEITGENQELSENMESLSKKLKDTKILPQDVEEMKIDSGYPWEEYISQKYSNGKTMAIIGSRIATPDMLEAARHQTKKALDGGWGIVTGGAKGIDEEAIREVLKQNAARKLTIYLPKSIEDQPHEVRGLLRNAKNEGAVIEEYAGAKLLKKTRPNLILEKAPYGQAAMARNKLIIEKANAVVAVQKGASPGTQHAIKEALTKHKPVKRISEDMSMKIWKSLKKVKSLGKYLKGPAKILPGLLPILEAIDLGKLWEDLDNLEKDIKAGTANEQQKKIWEWLEQQKRASEDLEIDIEIMNEEINLKNLELSYEADIFTKPTEHSGLYLVEPHAELIWTEAKITIVKSKKFEAHIGDPLYLISDKQCWGVIKLSEPKEIDKKIFKETYKDHLIEEHERKEWWGDSFELFSYEVELIEKYDKPRKVEIPAGIQVFINPESITFINP